MFLLNLIFIQTLELEVLYGSLLHLFVCCLVYAHVVSIFKLNAF